MRIKILIAYIIGIISVSFGQKHEIGGFLGLPKLIGDIGKTNYIPFIPSSFKSNEIPYSLGINYRYNLNPRQSLKLAFNYHYVFFDDNKAAEDYRYLRGLSGNNKLIEGALTYEYYFFDINSELHQTTASPYIFGGVSAINYKTKNYLISYDLNTDDLGNKIDPVIGGYQSTTTITEDSKLTFAPNFGIGVKVKFNYNWIFFAEIAFRPTTTDDLDYNYVSDKNSSFIINDPSLEKNPYITNIKQDFSDKISKKQTGNVVTRDWLVTSGVGIAYSFGRPPCYCK